MCDLAPEEQEEYFLWLELASARASAEGAPWDEWNWASSIQTEPVVPV
ncbi:MAG: hypothetical protein ACLPZM_03925 [Thermoplasmata archaeon]